MPLRAVLFDVGDTLWHTASRPEREELRRFGAEAARSFLATIGSEHSDPSEVATAAWQAANLGLVRGRRDLVEPDYSEMVRSALRDLGIEVSREQAGTLLRAIYVSGVQSGKEAYADARATLEELRARGFKLGIVTNRAIGGDHFRSDLADAGLDVRWDAIAVSVEVGHPKPHPAPFLVALKELGCAPSETMMVGDRLDEDIVGARQLGMTTAWRRSEGDFDEVVPDYTFDTVSELLVIPELQEAAP
jgi:HAD superfamily hydrolase (TIGR01662 family)